MSEAILTCLSASLSLRILCIMLLIFVNIWHLSDGNIDAIKAELMLNFESIRLTETNLPHARVTDFDLCGFLYFT